MRILAVHRGMGPGHLLAGSQTRNLENQGETHSAGQWIQCRTVDTVPDSGYSAGHGFPIFLMSETSIVPVLVEGLRRSRVKTVKITEFSQKLSF